MHPVNARMFLRLRDFLMVLEVDLKSTFMKGKATALQTIYPVTFKTCRAVQKANNLY